MKLCLNLTGTSCSRLDTCSFTGLNLNFLSGFYLCVNAVESLTRTTFYLVCEVKHR